jgi:hypothetical protein
MQALSGFDLTFYVTRKFLVPNENLDHLIRSDQLDRRTGQGATPATSAPDELQALRDQIADQAIDIKALCIMADQQRDLIIEMRRDIAALQVAPIAERAQTSDETTSPFADLGVIYQIRAQLWRNQTGYNRTRLRVYLWNGDSDSLGHKHGNQEFYAPLHSPALKEGQRALKAKNIPQSRLNPDHDAQMLGWGENGSHRKLAEVFAVMDYDGRLGLHIGAEQFDLGTMEPRETPGENEPVGDFWFIQAGTK